MFLKNYTSEVPASVTIQRIIALLVKLGVAGVSMDYSKAGKIVGLTFSIQIDPERSPVPIKFPADVDGATQALFEDYAEGTRLNEARDKIQWDPRGRRQKARIDFADQGERTAWRLMQDWLEVQVSMIQLKQADFMQVFLPYAWDGKQSYYHRIKSGGFAALMPPKPDPKNLEVVS